MPEKLRFEPVLSSETQSNISEEKPPSIIPPGNLADYERIRLVAQGSYGSVWLARNRLTGSLFALKFIAERSFKEARPYRREFEAILAFEPISRSHPGFVNILYVGEADGGFFYVMELADDVASGEKIDPVSYQPR